MAANLIGSWEQIPFHRASIPDDGAKRYARRDDDNLPVVEVSDHPVHGVRWTVYPENKYHTAASVNDAKRAADEKAIELGYVCPIHTGDGTFGKPVESIGAVARLPIPCGLKGYRHVVILKGLWDGRFLNVFAAENVAKRVGGTVYVVGAGQTDAWPVSFKLPLCQDCGPGWTEGGKMNCRCGALWNVTA